MKQDGMRGDGRPIASFMVCKALGKFGEWAFATLALLLVLLSKFTVAFPFLLIAACGERV
jgi:hypothetical protein